MAGILEKLFSRNMFNVKIRVCVCAREFFLTKLLTKENIRAILHIDNTDNTVW